MMSPANVAPATATLLRNKFFECPIAVRSPLNDEAIAEAPKTNYFSPEPIRLWKAFVLPRAVVVWKCFFDRELPQSSVLKKLPIEVMTLRNYYARSGRAC